MKKIVTVAAIAIAVTFALSACQQKSNMEKKGEKVDNAALQAKTNVKKVMREGPAEKAGEKIDEAQSDS